LFWDNTPDPAITLLVAGTDFLSAANNLKFVVFCFQPGATEA